jgi:hypothetical protein
MLKNQKEIEGDLDIDREKEIETKGVDRENDW